MTGSRGTSTRAFGAAVLVAASTVAAAFADDVPAARGPDGRGDGPGGATPLALASAKRAARPARRVTLPALDLAPLLAEDAARIRQPGAKARRVGVQRDFHPLRAPRRLLATTRGTEATPDGGAAWTAEIESPGALGVRVHFTRALLPPGVSLVVYDADEPSEAYGPFTAAGPLGTGEFWAPTVFGDRVAVEVRVAADAVGSPLVVVADAVQHIYAPRTAEPVPAGTAGGPKSAGSCEIDVQCSSTYASSAAHGVARISFVSGGSTYDCSGALLNDNDPTTSTPWFLTANHCVSTEAEANTVQFYWDYYASSCGGFAPSLQSVPQSFGATLAATSSTTDVTLLKITGSVPSGRTMLGWTSSSSFSGASVVSLHHPSGDIMKISAGSISGLQTDFYDVVWSSGVTEPGSSGSPLFDSSQQVIGQLWGGGSSCSSPSSTDMYGRFDQSYPLLKPYIWDITGSTPPPPDPGPPPPPGPGPVGQPPDFFLGLWQKWPLGDGDSKAWMMDIHNAGRPGITPRLTIRVKGHRDAWAKVTSPSGVETVHPKGKSYVGDIVDGLWPIELFAADGAPTKVLKVKASKNW